MVKWVAAFTGIAAAACTSGTSAPARPGPLGPRLLWTDSIIATMSLRDRAAQLVWPQLFGDYTPLTSAGWARIEQSIMRDHVGGFIMSVGSPMETASKINAMQRLSVLPLLFGADYETGAGFRVRGGYFLPNNIYLGGATVFPPQMALGATRDTSLAYAQGRITAIEGRALGVHIAFAPVLDVNNNPANPVIGVRSFGEDPHLVAAMGDALVRGIQEHGMLATGKHFPGHGHTDENSHLTITTVHASRARIDSVELVPFRRAIAAGLGAMMTFHGVIPALDSNPVPATLSPKVMTGLLRRELGFTGLVITDAMDMNGVLARVSAAQPGSVATGNYGNVNSIGIAEACKLAIAAGADILLMPSDIPGAIDAVVDGVREGRFSQARVDSSFRRVLELKRRFGLDRRRLVDLDSVRALVADTNHLAVAEVAAERSITLAKDSLSLVPLVGGANTGTGTVPRVLSITVATRTDLPAGATFDAELRRLVPNVRSEIVNPDDPSPNFQRLLALGDSADIAVVSSYLSTSSTTATASAPDSIASFVRELARRKPRTIVVAFGNPYFLQQISNVSTYVVAWGGFPVSQRAAARALLGTAPINGRLPISIPPLLRFGAGERRPAVARATASPSSDRP